MAFFTFQLLTY